MKPDISTPKPQTRISVAVIVIGALLMAFQIYSDSEPGAIPLFLVVSGIAWYLIARARSRRSGQVG